MDDIAKIIAKVNPALKGPSWEHKIIYNSSSETLEPIYFWILDFITGLGFKVEKLVDNFSATPGGGYFSEISSKATRLQEEGMKILGAVNQVIKSIINILYDLKEFEIRLKQYEMAKSKKKEEAEAGILGLKQIWMDNVDIKKGKGSINAMTYELNFATLRDAFMFANKVEDVDKMDLNDRVKRVLKPRIAEFNEWREKSEVELKKRFEIEKSYLKSQVATLKMYARWVKPYLKAAEQLSMRDNPSAALIKAFDTNLLELQIFAKKALDVKSEATEKNLPESFKNLKLKRNYYSCIFIDFTFRGIPSRIQTREGGHYVFGGRVEVGFKAYALNDDEINKMKEIIEEADLNDMLSVAEIQVTESLEQIQDDLKKYLEPEKEEEKKEKGFLESFTEIFSGKKEKKIEEKTKKKKEKAPEIIKKDSWEESIIRALAEMNAATTCFKVYDVYKKSHGMASVSELEPGETHIGLKKSLNK